MSLSMRVYVTPESDLRAFSVAPRTLQIWLRQPHPQPELSVDEYWKDLDAIIAAEPLAEARSLLTPQGGDWTYPGAADRGAHGLSPASTRQLLTAIEQIAAPQVEAYVRQTRSGGEGQALEPPSEEVSAVTTKLLLLLNGMRELCGRALSRNFGLLLALWEKP